MLADFSGRTVRRPSQTELSAIGAAMMAANGIGHPISPNIVVPEREFLPEITAEARGTHRACWKKAVDRASLDT